MSFHSRVAPSFPLRNEGRSELFRNPLKLSAYLAAGVFTAASGAANVASAWHRGADGSSSVIWSAVSLAVTLTYVLSWPAVSKSFAAKKRGQAFVLLCGLILTGGYSIASALGTAAGGRMQAAATVKADQIARKNAADAIAQADATLATLPQSRPSAVVNADIEALKAANPKAGDCSTMDGPVSRTVCPKLAVLKAEIDTTTTRADLQKQRSIVLAKLEAMGAERQGNSDAAAIVLFTDALGVTTNAEAVNKLLTLLSVVVIEVGSGLALTVAMGLGAEHSPERAQDTLAVHAAKAVQAGTAPGYAPQPTAQHASQNAPEEALEPIAASLPVHKAHCAPNTPAKRAAKPTAKVSGRKTRYDVAEAFQGTLRDAGGQVSSSVRGMAKVVGCSLSTLQDVVEDLKASGALTVEASRSGTTYRLAA